MKKNTYVVTAPGPGPSPAKELQGLDLPFAMCFRTDDRLQGRGKAQVRALCIEFIEADINKGFAQVLWPYLLKREKLN